MKTPDSNTSHTAQTIGGVLATPKWGLGLLLLICFLSFFSEAKAGVLASWETERQVYFARVNPKTLKVSEPVSPPGSSRRKHSVAVGNEQGEVLLAWTEGTGWQKGGALAWQLYDKAGNPTEKGRADGVPVWSLVSAFAKQDGGFVIVY